MSTRINPAGPALELRARQRQEETDCEEQSGNALFGCSLNGGSI